MFIACSTASSLGDEQDQQHDAAGSETDRATARSGEESRRTQHEAGTERGHTSSATPSDGKAECENRRHRAEACDVVRVHHGRGDRDPGRHVEPTVKRMGADEVMNAGDRDDEQSRDDYAGC